MTKEPRFDPRTERPRLPPEVDAQLQRLLAVPAIADSNHLGRLLRYLVVESLAGQGGRLKGYAIGVEVFQRGAAFDPQSDPIVRVYAGKLRAALGHYYATTGAADRLVMEIPKGAYRVRFQEREPATPPPALAETAPPAYLKQRIGIAVMPFQCAHSDETLLAFADGLGEELSAALTRMQSFRIVGLSSTRSFQGQAMPQQAAATLAVRFLLEGSVRQAGTTLKVQLRVTDEADASQIWSDRYEYQLEGSDQLFQIEAELARQVVTAIADDHGAIPRALLGQAMNKPLESLSSYEAILLHRYYQLHLTTESAARAQTALESSTRQEPGCALTWARLANLYLDDYGLGIGRLANGLQLGLTATEQAMRCNPQCQDAIWSQAHGHFLQGELELFRHRAMEAIGINPEHAYIQGFAGLLLALSGDWELGIPLVRDALTRNPYLPGWMHAGPCFYHYRRGEFRLALKNALLIKMPDFFADAILCALAQDALGLQSEALVNLDRALALQPLLKNHAQELLGHYLRDPSLLQRVSERLERLAATPRIEGCQSAG